VRIKDSEIFFYDDDGDDDGTGVWIQGLEYLRQVLYLLSYFLSPFCFSYFSGKFSHFCPRQTSNWDPPTCNLPHVPACPALLRHVSLFQTWPGTTTQAGGITGMSHHPWSLIYFFQKSLAWNEVQKLSIWLACSRSWIKSLAPLSLSLSLSLSHTHTHTHTQSNRGCIRESWWTIKAKLATG
jgi:hypothetical protein